MTAKFVKSAMLSRHVAREFMPAPAGARCQTVIDRLSAPKIIANQKLDCAWEAPTCLAGGVVSLKGLRAPNGAIIKVAGMNNLPISRPARCSVADAGRGSQIGPADPTASRPMIKIDAVVRASDKTLSLIEPEVRRKPHVALPNNYQTTELRHDADQLGPALKAAVTDVGGKAKVVCYADI